MALRGLLVTVLLGATFVLFLGGKPRLDQPTPRILLYLVAATYGATIVYALLFRRLSSSRAFAAVQIAGDLGAWTVLAYLTGGASSGFSFLFGLSILGSAILLGRLGAVLTAAASAALLAALAAATTSGWIPPLSDQPRAFSVFVPGEVTFFVFVNLTSFTLVALLGGHLAERLRLARGALERAERAAASVVRSMRDGILTLDRRGRIEGTNPAALQILQRASVAVLGTPLDEVAPKIALAIAGGQNRGEGSCLRPDGTKVPVAYRASPLVDEQAEPAGTLLLLEDLGEIRGVREELARAERLAAVGRLAAALAHEIRNPLGGILGSIDLLRGAPNLSDEQQRLCEIARRETARLSELVGDMLDFARPRRPEPQPMDLCAVCREVADGFRASLGQPLSFRLEAPESLAATLDPGQIRQVVWNLLRNAAQASSSEGQILLRVAAEDGHVLVEVADRGPGVPPEERERVFEMFYSTRLQGTGLGLPLVRQIVVAHRGTIEVDEAPGGGAVFRVRLPRHAKVSASSAPPPP